MNLQQRVEFYFLIPFVDLLLLFDQRDISARGKKEEEEVHKDEEKETNDMLTSTQMIPQNNQKLYNLE